MKISVLGKGDAAGVSFLISCFLLSVMFRRVSSFSFRQLTKQRIPNGIISSRTTLPRHFASVLSSTTTTSRLYQSAVSSDRSAVSKSRAPFRMPKDSPDDSSQVNKSGSGKKDLAWNQLGLLTELVNSLQNEMSLQAPTMVQQMVIPELLKLQEVSIHDDQEDPKSDRHLAFLAATGSGKTLAYALPIMQLLKNEETFGDGALPAFSQRPKSRPRAVILCPTRELARQIQAVVKQLSHSIKLSTVSIYGGESVSKQRKQLDKPVDIVVATPGRLMKHIDEGSLVLSSKYLKYVVLDEMDTMLEQGFAADLQRILYPQLYHKKGNQDVDVNKDLVETAPSVILTSATMTQAIQKMVGHSSKDELVNAKKHYSKPEVVETEIKPGKKVKVAAESGPKKPVVLPRMKVMKAPGLHKTVPRLQQTFIDTASVDKISLLIDVLSSDNNRSQLTMVFCNTANSCRAVEYALTEARIAALSYHGELNSQQRAQNLDTFRKSGDNADAGLPRVLVATDLAARGLDIPTVDHVVMFDFPLNALDYLHRSGRTARGVGDRHKNHGRVTALVAKRDKVLANAIEAAVQRGDPLDGLSSRKSDYLPGGRLATQRNSSGNSGRRTSSPGNRRGPSAPPASKQRRSQGRKRP